MYRYYITPGEYEIAESNGISKRVLDARVRDYGWDIEKAITKKVNNRNRYGVEVYNYLQKNNISLNLFLIRLKNEWNIVKACTVPPQNPGDFIKEHRKNELLKNTGKYKVTAEMIQVAAVNGINERTLKARIYTMKWDIEKAITTPVRAIKSNGIKFGKGLLT